MYIVYASLSQQEVQKACVWKQQNQVFYVN